MTNSTSALEELVDLDRYPIHDSKHPRYRSLLEYCQAELADDGCCSVPNFFRTEAIFSFATMAERLSDKVHRQTEDSTPYGGDVDDNLPADHPRRVTYRRGGGFICADLLDKDSGLWTFFNAAITREFAMDAFETNPLYQYADPLACMPITSMWPGDEFPWHFDTNEIAMSVMLQASQGGGIFEYVPNVRGVGDECYERVQAIFAGNRDGVRQLDLRPGDVQLFRGRYTLHRVAKVTGDCARHVALPSWSTQPGQVGVIERMSKSFGRTLPIHHKRAGSSPDQLRP